MGKWHRTIQAISIHLAITFCVMIAAGFTLKALIPYQYEGVQTFESMTAMNPAVKAVKYKELMPLNIAEQQQPRLDIIMVRKHIRVGYYKASLPFTFRNNNNHLVGYDMELLNEFAKDLGINIALVYLESNEQEAKLLKNGALDIVIGGHAITPMRALKVSFSDAYTHHTAGLLINDSQRDAFADIYNIQAMKEPNIGIGKSKYYRRITEDYFPNAKITEVSDIRLFLKGKHPDVDAVLFSAEVASAWSMLYPEFSAVIPKGLKLKAPVGLILPKGQSDYVDFINTWLQLKRDNSFQQKVYDYWILGKNPKAKKTSLVSNERCFRLVIKLRQLVSICVQQVASLLTKN